MRSAKIVVPNTFAGLGHSAPGGLGHDDVFFDLWIKGLGHFTGRAGHREGERLAPGPNQFSKLALGLGHLRAVVDVPSQDPIPGAIGDAHNVAGYAWLAMEQIEFEHALFSFSVIRASDPVITLDFPGVGIIVSTGRDGLCLAYSILAWSRRVSLMVSIHAPNEGSDLAARAFDSEINQSVAVLAMIESHFRSSVRRFRCGPGRSQRGYTARPG